MTELISKKGWSRVTFGEMAEHVAERIEPTPDDSETYVGLEHLDAGSLTVRRWGADIALVGTKLRMRKGDILFARRNAYLRRVALAPHDGLFSAHGMVLRARPHVALPDFLPFFMQSDLFMDRAEQISVGSLSPTINWGTLKEQRFDLPPLEEQRRLAGLLATVQRVGDHLLSVLAAASVVLEADRDATFGDSRLARTPLSNTASVRYGVGQPPPQAPDGTVMIRATNIDRGAIRTADLMRVDLNALPESKRVLLNEGDILLVRSGAYTGDSALISKEWAGSLAGYDLVICPNRSTIHPQYLAHFLLARRTVVSILGALSARTAQPHLNTQDVGEIQVPCPDMATQVATVERLEATRRCMDSVEERLEELRHAKAAAMTQMREAR